MFSTKQKAGRIILPVLKFTEVKGAAKTSNSPPKCIWILERGELCSKSKCLRKQVFSTSSGPSDYLLLKEKAFVGIPFIKK